MLHTDPTGLCVPESDGPLACDPSLRSSLQNYLRDSRPFDNRARGDQGYQGINVVFDSYPEEAYAYSATQDSELRRFVTQQLPWIDAEATIAQLEFNLQQWKLNYSQKNNLPTDVGGAAVGMLGLGALHSPQVSGRRPHLENLSDAERLNSARNPTKGDPIRINTRTGKVVQGNGRAYELKRRAADPKSSITPDTEIPYEPYTPDHSMFLDLQ